MRDLIVDFPYKEDFVLVDSSVGVPVKISHRVKFTSNSSLSPSRKERAVDLIFFHEGPNHCSDLKNMILNIIQDLFVVNVSCVSQELIQKSIRDVAVKVSGVG